MKKFTFTIILWNECGDEKLFRKQITIRRVNQKNAKEFLIKKYPFPHFIELDSIEQL